MQDFPATVAVIASLAVLYLIGQRQKIPDWVFFFLLSVSIFIILFFTQ